MQNCKYISKAVWGSIPKIYQAIRAFNSSVPELICFLQLEANQFFINDALKLIIEYR